MLGRQLTKYCDYILSEKHKERIWKNAKIKNKYQKLLDLHTNTDTSDTNKKLMSTFSNTPNIGNINDNIKGGNIHDIILKKVSEVPPTQDTTDTNSQEEFAMEELE